MLNPLKTTRKKNNKKNNRKNNRGFTLIELIASFTILSIIAVALFQLFTAAEKISERAYQTDKASIMAINLAESFKRDPDGIYDIDFFAENEEENYTFMDQSENIAVKFFDENLNALPVERKDPLRKNFYDPLVPAGASFIMTTSLKDESPMESYGLINPEPFVIFDINRSFGYNLLIEATISGSGEEMIRVSLRNAVFTMMVLASETVPMQRVIENGGKMPIRVVFTGNPAEGARPINCYINVINKPDIDLQLFIHTYDTVFAGATYAARDVIAINPVEGTCSAIYMDIDAPYVESCVKSFTVNISRLDNTGSIAGRLLEFTRSAFFQK